MMNSESIVETISLSLRLRDTIIDWLFDRMSLEISREDVANIERLDELIAFMLEDDDSIIFQFRIRDPEYAMGRNDQHACENYMSDGYDEDEIVFTGYWQHV